MKLIYGSKAGQNKPHQPTIADDTIASITKITALYLIGEGEIKGLVNGSKSIFFENTPLEDADGNRNFENVTWEIRHGTIDQTHIPGVPSASTEQLINTELRHGTPWTRLFNDIQLSSVNVNLSWARLSDTTDKNDVIGTTVDYAIDLRTDSGAWVTVLSKSVTAKASGRYQRTHNIALPEANRNWQIRVRKLTADGDNERKFNKMQIDSISEIIDAKLCYPHSAVIKLTWDSRAFGNTPKVSFDIFGRYVNVPSNYDAEARTSSGIWDGLFKEAYTTNPAWIYYDIISNDRYGLGDKLKPYMINKWAIEHIARLCDVMVDDGKGGLEPRYTCNMYLQTAETAFDVLQHIAGIFRGMAFWNGSQIILDADTYKDCDYVITRANVIGGEFVKTGTAANERHTIAKVGYSNPDNNYEIDYVIVRNEKAIAELGINQLDLSAVACTSEGEAYRFGLAALLTEQNRTQTVSFAMGLDGSLPMVGDRIDIPDIMFTGHNTGGRISGVSKDRTAITVDRDNVPASVGDQLVVNLESGSAQTRDILSINGRVITVAAAFDEVAKQNAWAVSTKELPTMPFIVLSQTANDDGTQYSYTALQYDVTIQAQIDNGTIIDNKPPLPPIASMIIAAPDSVEITSRHRIEQAQTITTLVIAWTQVKDAVAYDVEWRKDDGNWIKLPRTGNINAEIEGIYSGNYLARVRAVSAFDAVSKPTSSILTAIKGKAGTPPQLSSLTATGLLFGMQIDWTFSAGSGDTAYTEIQVGSEPDVNVTTLGQFGFNTDTHTVNGLQDNLAQSYRGRIVDKLGNVSPWTPWVTGTTDASADKVLHLVQGQINEGSLNAALTSKIDKIEVVERELSEETATRIQDIIDTKQQADAAQRAADNAKQAASAAATAAGNKGEVIYQWQTPAAARQQPQNLWIDTTGGKNTPKRWDGSAWVVVTDKAATDAQRAADAAQSTANTAINNAATAQAKADQAALDATDKAAAAEAAAKDFAKAEAKAKADAAQAAASGDATDKANAAKSAAQAAAALDAKAKADAAQAAASALAADAQATADAAKDAAQAADEKAAAAQSTADTAQANAKTADEKAVAAQQSATAALSSLTDISADNKLTPVEKKQVKLIFDDIQRVNSDLLARATKYDVVATPYKAAYSALVSYITPKLADMSTTSVIVRTAFNSKFDDLFLKRADLNTTIVNAAKLVADTAQNTANEALDKANTANDKVVTILDEQIEINNELGLQYETLQGVILDYKPRYASKDRYASKSRGQNWTYAKTVARDNYVTNERITNLQSDFDDTNATVRQELETLATNDAAVASSFNQLKAQTGENSGLIQKLNIAIATPGTGLAAKFDELQSKAQAAEVLITEKGEIIFSYAAPPANKQEGVNLWFKLKNEDDESVSQTPHRWDGTKWVELKDSAALAAKADAESARKAAKTADEKAAAAQSTADTAQANAKTADEKAVAAQQSATAALSSLTDISADNKLTPVEKKQVKLIFDDIQRVNSDLLARATKYDVVATPYKAAYSALVSYITPKLADMSTTSVIVRTAFNSKFDDLFLKRADLNTTIVNAAKLATDAAQAAADEANQKLEPDNLATLVEGSGAFSDEFGSISGKFSTMQGVVDGQQTAIETVSAVGNVDKLKNEIAKARLDKDAIKLQAQSDSLTSAIADYDAKIAEITAKRNAATDAVLKAEYAKQIADLNDAKADAVIQKGDIAAQVTQLAAEKKVLDDFKETQTDILAQHTVKINTKGFATGFGLMLDKSGFSEFGIDVDSFYLGAPDGTKSKAFVHYSTPQNINGVVIPIGTYLDAAYIAKASIDLAQINIASITSLSALSATIGHFKSAETGKRLEIQDGLVSVYDDNNVLRVRLGLW